MLLKKMKFSLLHYDLMQWLLLALVMNLFMATSARGENTDNEEIEAEIVARKLVSVPTSEIIAEIDRRERLGLECPQDFKRRFGDDVVISRARTALRKIDGKLFEKFGGIEPVERLEHCRHVVRFQKPKRAAEYVEVFISGRTLRMLDIKRSYPRWRPPSRHRSRTAR